MNEHELRARVEQQLGPRAARELKTARALGYQPEGDADEGAPCKQCGITAASCAAWYQLTASWCCRSCRVNGAQEMHAHVVEQLTLEVE